MNKKQIGIVSISLILAFVLGLSITASGQTSPIPAWIKNTARWWADGQVSDDEYIKSLQWLINNKILVVPQSNNAQTTMQQTASGDDKINQGILDNLDSCTKVTDDTKLKICIDYAKKAKQICDNNNNPYPACTDPRLVQLADQPAMSPFSKTVCKQEFGTVQMTGQFTNDGTDKSFISLKLGVIDSDGNVVATGAGIISNIKAYETKIFDASAIYSGSFSNCKIQVDTQLP